MIVTREKPTRIKPGALVRIGTESIFLVTEVYPHRQAVLGRDRDNRWVTPITLRLVIGSDERETILSIAESESQNFRITEILSMNLLGSILYLLKTFSSRVLQRFDSLMLA